MPKMIGIGLAIVGILIAVTGSPKGEKAREPHESLALSGVSFALTVAYVLGIEKLVYFVSTVITRRSTCGFWMSRLAAPGRDQHWSRLSSTLLIPELHADSPSVWAAVLRCPGFRYRANWLRN